MEIRYYVTLEIRCLFQHTAMSILTQLFQLILETTDIWEELDAQKEVIDTKVSRLKEIEEVDEGPSQQGFLEVLVKEIAEN